MRRVQPSDFHVPAGTDARQIDCELWIEVDIEFEETADENGEHPAIAPFFTHMALDDPNGLPRVRVRLTATLDVDDYVEEVIEYITQVDSDGAPAQRSVMSRYDRAMVEVHYLPARRDPADHIAYTATSLLGRLLRAADWTDERDETARLADELSDAMVANPAVAGIGEALTSVWGSLHHGPYFKDPSIAFGRGDLEGVLRQITMVFSPGPGGETVDVERLSDGHKSMLYVALVLAWREIARSVLRGDETSFDQDRLRPPVHVVLALEEPENSMAPQHLGRIVRQLRGVCAEDDMQGVVATHSPSLLHRVEPEDIRFLRLNAARETQVRTVEMPVNTDEAAKYVREAVRAYPELYFSRLVVLGEGDSEQIVLPRVLAAAGIADDDASVSVVPLGGRHVNHFWRLLERLEIPYVTLLDLDGGRHQGGWGRVKYAAKQVNKIKPNTFDAATMEKRLPAWNADVDFPSEFNSGFLCSLQRHHNVFFSSPLDLDLMMLEAYPDAYGVAAAAKKVPSETTKKAVLGQSGTNSHRYAASQRRLFDEYTKQFKLGSKPASHLSAMAAFDSKDDEFVSRLPLPLLRLVEAVKVRLDSIPE